MVTHHLHLFLSGQLTYSQSSIITIKFGDASDKMCACLSPFTTSMNVFNCIILWVDGLGHRHNAYSFKIR